MKMMKRGTLDVLVKIILILSALIKIATELKSIDANLRQIKAYRG